MKITAIHEAVLPISSDIRNAYIDFSKMTASIVAVATDVIREVAEGIWHDPDFASVILVKRCTSLPFHLAGW